MPTTLNITPDQIAHYRDSAQQRYKQEAADIERRQKQAWQAAKKAAQILKTNFQATRVVVFGSLVHEAGFTRWSDVDIAAWGIALEDTFKAIGFISEMEAAVPVNLIVVETARPYLLAVIAQDGIEL